jgi:Fic family protein
MVYRPDFTIDNEILTLVSDIAVLIDRIPKGTPTSRHLELKRNGKIRSIHSSAAIEGNKLSLEQVTDIINGKHVIGNPKDILEIKNARRAYDRVADYDPFSANDLLEAHGMMMNDLVDSPGEFRDCGVGVYKGPVAVHIAPEHEDVPYLINDLIDWCRSSDAHPLIIGCVFHCRFEYIHPFLDGNGRMGRLWHSLLLSKWRPAFGYLPIESWIHLNRKGYYNSLREADKGNITAFIKFMLTVIKVAADDFVDEITYAPKRRLSIRDSIIDIISGDPEATAASMAEVLGVSDRTIKRHLSSMTNAGLIKRVGSDKTGHWYTEMNR